MDKEEIIFKLIDRMQNDNLWFTSKTDPIYLEPGYYYELDEYGELTEKSINKIVKEIENYIGDGASDYEDAIEVWITDALSDSRIASREYITTKFKPKELVDQIKAYATPEIITENVKARLEEENTKSLNLISSMFTSKDFDSDSAEGQILMRTSELFNALSAKGYDVQVTFDNGESQSTIILSKLGGQVIITITNANEPLRCFTNGSFEITDDALNTLKDIKDEIEVL